MAMEVATDVMTDINNNNNNNNSNNNKDEALAAHHRQQQADEDNASSASSAFEWTTATILQSIALFGIAGVAEIIGGWMVWMAIRGNADGKKPAWFAVAGSALLVVYGFIPCLQPTDSFGRIYAAYGGFFIVLSFLFGWALDGDRPDIGDIVGGSTSLVGVLLLLFWPR